MENTNDNSTSTAQGETTTISLSSSRMPLDEITNTVAVSSAKTFSESDSWSEILKEIMVIKENVNQLGTELDDEMKKMDILGKKYSDSMKQASPTVTKSVRKYNE